MIVNYLLIHLISKILHPRCRVSPRRLTYLLIVGSDYCVMRFAYALHMRCQNLVLHSCLYTEPATKLICSNVHSRADTLSASMMLLCCSLASSSFTPRKSSFLWDDRLNSKMYSVRWCLLCHPASDSETDFLSGRNNGITFRALSQRSIFQFLLPFPSPSAILVCISAQTLPPAKTWPYYFLHQVWQTWAYSLVFKFVQLACWHTDVSRWSGEQPWRLSPFYRRRHCWCAHTWKRCICLLE